MVLQESKNLQKNNNLYIMNILFLSIKDYFTKPMLGIVLYPLLGSILVLYFAFFSIADIGLDQLSNTQLQIEQHQTQILNGEVVENSTSETYTGSSIVNFFLQYTVTSWIVSFLVYTIGIFAIGYLSIFVSLLIVGLLTPKILAIVHKRHYTSFKVDGYGTILGGIWKLIKTTLIMLFLLIALSPFYFIPLINIIAINLPFYYFFHKMLNYDVASTLMQKENAKKLYFYNSTSVRFKTLWLYVVSLIPFVAFFIAVFYIIYLGHTYFTMESEVED